MLEHKINSTLNSVDSLVDNSVEVFKVIASNKSYEDKCTLLENIRHRCVKLAAKVGHAIIVKEVVSASFAVAAKSGGILSAIGAVGSAVMNSFLFAVIGMFLKGVIVAGIVVSLFTTIVSRFIG